VAGKLGPFRAVNYGGKASPLGKRTPTGEENLDNNKNILTATPNHNSHDYYTACAVTSNIGWITTPYINHVLYIILISSLCASSYIASSLLPPHLHYPLPRSGCATIQMAHPILLSCPAMPPQPCLPAADRPPTPA
jgi:hypothetical protein